MTRNLLHNKNDTLPAPVNESVSTPMCFFVVQLASVGTRLFCISANRGVFELFSGNLVSLIEIVREMKDRKMPQSDWLGFESCVFFAPLFELCARAKVTATVLLDSGTALPS